MDDRAASGAQPHRRSPLSQLTFWLRASGGGIGFGLAVLWYAILLAVPMSKARRRQSFARVMAHLCCPPLGIDVSIRGRENIGRHHPCIYASNHQSQVDYPIAGHVFPGNALVIASQIGDWPVMGALYRSSGCIVLDRDSPVKSAAALDAAEAALRNGQSIWIFAEGTRGKVPGRLGKFKRGAFRLAAITGRPVVPIVISPLKPSTDLRGRRLDRQQVVLQALTPMFPSGNTPEAEEELRDAVRQRMLDALATLGPLASAPPSRSSSAGILAHEPAPAS